MSVTLQQTDTAPDFAAGAYCSGLSAGANAGAVNRATEGGSAGSSEDTITLNANEAIKRYIYFECDIPSGYDGAAGDWVINLHHTSGTTTGVGVVQAYVCRVNSSGVNQETLGSITGLTLTWNSTGVKVITVNQASSSTFAVGDKVMIVIAVTNPLTMIPFIFGITPDDTITAPGSAAVAAYEQNTHRGRNDDGSETTATWKAAAGADYSQAVDEIFRQRFLIKCTGAGEAGFKPTVEYRVNHAGAGYGAWTAVPAGVPVSSKTMEVVRVDSANLTHGADTTQQIGAGTFTTDNNGVIENGALATLTSVVNQEWEVEVALFLGRIANNPGDTYQFRITNDGVALDTYTDTPEVTCLGATPPHTDTPVGSGGGIRRFMFHLGG